jgi:uncharacterized protein YecT (DUF1311 family)
MKEKRELSYKTSISIIIIALFSFLSTQAIAASFDCKKAASWVEKAVCSNPELSKLDEEMAKAYHDALANLSPEGQKETKQYQKQWLKEIPKYCKARLKLKFVDDTDECLKDVFKERNTQLQQSLIKFPGRIFRNVHVSHSEANEACQYLFVERKLIYPQMENPRDENEKFWNTHISQKASDDYKIEADEDRCTNINEEYTVSFSNKHFISLQGWLFWYAHGAPHGYKDVKTISWLLEAKRELQASDLFDDKTGWRTKLAALVSQKLKENKKDSYEIKPSALMNIVTSQGHWVVLKDGLGIQFVEYELGSRTAPLISIDWKALEPYLSKNGRSLIYD